MPETPAPERICLFGGTFDPVHIGHLKVANEALRACNLDRVLFVPAAHPPHKHQSAITPFEDRYRMVEIACKPYPSFVPSRLEAGDEPNFTIDTLTRFSAELLPGDTLFFLIGADAFAELASWKEWQRVIVQAQFIVVSRPGIDYPIPPGARVIRLDDVEIPISSSSIRERLIAGETVAEVPAEVREYIEQHGLYGWKKNDS
ncbi:MAG TPA: nicotinate-nucleotide adenylyltransferase [Bryobacteraceae bacterium]|jgi:nicotinate-nucleotide adenylyltransferase|nr:nicotinate-nucleotide adenylyltransferase [Bryobacteraceae bacterium]